MGKEDAGHMSFLDEVCDNDVEHIKSKEEKYKGSWKKRGGVGAFMMLARKWDRIENQTEECHYDIFKLCCEDRYFRENQVGDLRRYLLLVEAELRSMETNAEEPRWPLHERNALEKGESGE